MANCETWTVVLNLLITAGVKRGEELSRLEGQAQAEDGGVGFYTFLYDAYWQTGSSPVVLGVFFYLLPATVNHPGKVSVSLAAAQQ